MANQNRVLSRIGARELTIDEMEQVAGAHLARTNVCSLANLTVTGDGDACTDHDNS
jgi:hypothetical protein